MVVKTTSFDDNPGGAASYNAETTEPNWFDYRITARFQEPAEAVVFLRDVDGSLMQKYNDDSRAVYIGPGRLKIEKPAATTIFDGRIGKAVHDKTTNTLTLMCKDWLSQLEDARINKDMREPLDGSGKRQSTIHQDPDNSAEYLTWPVIRRLFSAQADDGIAFNDETTEANDDTADDMTLLPVAPGVNAAYYFGFENPVGHMSLFISQQGDWVGTNVWEYWDGDSWESLNNGPTGPDSTFETAGQVDYTWDVEGDWATTLVNGDTAYFIRARVNTFSSITTQPLGKWAWGEHYLVDDGAGFTPDAYNGMFVVFPKEMSGEVTVNTGPYKQATDEVLDIDAFNSDIEDLWTPDDNGHTMSDNNTDWNSDYYFHILFDQSNFYKASSITAGRIQIEYHFIGTNASIDIEYYDWDAEVFEKFEELKPAKSLDVHHKATVQIPLHHLQSGEFFNSDGETIIRLAVDWGSGVTTIKPVLLKLEVDFSATQDKTKVLIEDTETGRLRVATDLTFHNSDYGCWELMPYCIVQEAFKHIDSAESPGDLVTDGGGEVSGTGPDPLVALTSAAGIEHTSGISLRRYEERVRLEMLKDLANIDKVAFWMALGTVALTWKSTFNDGSPTALTDIDVIAWTRGEYNFKPVFNEMHLYGPKTGNLQSVYDTADASPDPGLDSKVRYGVTRSNVIKSTGTTNEFELVELGEALVERDEDVLLFLNADIRGVSDLRLGDEVSITSTYLGLTTEKYVITFWEYSYLPDRTTIRLHPRNSTKGFVPNAMFGDNIRRFVQGEPQREADIAIPIPETTTT